MLLLKLVVCLDSCGCPLEPHDGAHEERQMLPMGEHIDEWMIGMELERLLERDEAPFHAHDGG